MLRTKQNVSKCQLRLCHYTSSVKGCWIFFKKYSLMHKQDIWFSIHEQYSIPCGFLKLLIKDKQWKSTEAQIQAVFRSFSLTWNQKAAYKLHQMTF